MGAVNTVPVAVFEQPPKRRRRRDNTDPDAPSPGTLPDGTRLPDGRLNTTRTKMGSPGLTTRITCKHAPPLCFCQRNIPVRAVVASRSGPGLLLVYMGEMFRSGGQYSRAGETVLDNAMLAQQQAIQSVEEHVLAPARLARWLPAVVIDISLSSVSSSDLSDPHTQMESMPGRHRANMRANMRKWHEAVRRLVCKLQPLAAHISRSDTSTTPSMRWARAIRKAETTARVTSTPWESLLVLRLDLIFKRPLSIPPPIPIGVPTTTTTVPVLWLAFRMCHSCKLLSSEDVASPFPRVNDVLALVPRVHVPHLMRTLDAHVGCPDWMGLHHLAGWLNESRGSNGVGVNYFLEEGEYDSDPCVSLF